MKNKLLLAVLLFAGGIATAQESISFETSEGYVLGPVDGQNDWHVNENGVAGSTNAQVFYLYHSTGANSLQFKGTNDHDAPGVEATRSFAPPANKFTITQDVLTSAVDIQFSSNFFVIAGNKDGSGIVTPVTVFVFYGNGTLTVATDHISGAQYNSQDVGTFEAGTWYQLKEEFDTVAGTVTYYINGEQVYEGNFLSDSPINAIDFQFGHYVTSFYVDNINIFDTTVAGIHQQPTADFTVYPNPANNFITIENTVNAVINGIAITDVNGRIVKSVTLNGVINAQVNVADLAAGVYMLSIATQKGTVVKKMVKN